MKILIFHSGSLSTFPSGEYNVAFFENQLLNKYGFESKLVVYKNEKLLSKYFKFLLPFNNIWSFNSIKKVRSEVNNFKPDIIHFHGLTPFLSPSAIYAVKKYNIPTYITLHSVKGICLEGAYYRNDKLCDKCISRSQLFGVLWGCNRGFFNSFLFYISNKIFIKFISNPIFINKIIVVSEFLKNEYIKIGINKDRIIVKGNFINQEMADNIYNESINTNKEGITYVSRISNAKGLEIILFLIKNINVKFNIIGDGPGLDKLRNFCLNNKLHNVILHGNLSSENTLREISKSYCTIIPSICAESFSLVALESFAVGVPVIATKVGGLGELVNKSGAGFVIENDYQYNFLKKIQFLLDNPKLRDEFSIQSRAFFKYNFNEISSLNNIFNIYKIKNE